MKTFHNLSVLFQKNGEFLRSNSVGGRWMDEWGAMVE